MAVKYRTKDGGWSDEPTAWHRKQEQRQTAEQANSETGQAIRSRLQRAGNFSEPTDEELARMVDAVNSGEMDIDEAVQCYFTGEFE